MRIAIHAKERNSTSVILAKMTSFFSLMNNGLFIIYQKVKRRSTNDRQLSNIALFLMVVFAAMSSTVEMAKIRIPLSRLESMKIGKGIYLNGCPLITQMIGLRFMGMNQRSAFITMRPYWMIHKILNF